MLRGLLSAKAGFGPTLHLPVYLPALEPHHRRLDVGHFWLESDPALRRDRGKRLCHSEHAARQVRVRAPCHRPQRGNTVLLHQWLWPSAVMALIIGSAGASLTEVILLKSMFRTPDDCGLPYRDPRHGDLDGLSDAAAVLNYQCFKPPGFE